MSGVTGLHNRFKLYPPLTYATLLVTSYYCQRTLCIYNTVKRSSASLRSSAGPAPFLVSQSTQMLGIQLCYSQISALFLAPPFSCIFLPSSPLLYRSSSFLLARFLCSTLLATLLFFLSRLNFLPPSGLLFFPVHRSKTFCLAPLLPAHPSRSFPSASLFRFFLSFFLFSFSLFQFPSSFFLCLRLQASLTHDATSTCRVLRRLLR